MHSDDGQCRDVFWRIAAAPPPPPPPPTPPPAFSAHSTKITMRIIAVRCRDSLLYPTPLNFACRGGRRISRCIRAQGWAPYRVAHAAAPDLHAQGCALCIINAASSCIPFDLCLHGWAPYRVASNFSCSSEKGDKPTRRSSTP